MFQLKKDSFVILATLKAEFHGFLTPQRYELRALKSVHQFFSRAPTKQVKKEFHHLYESERGRIAYFRYEYLLS